MSCQRTIKTTKTYKMEDNLIDEIPRELTKVQEWQIKEAKDYVKAAEWMLYALGIINLLYLIPAFDLISGVELFIGIFLSLIYVAAGIGTHYKPLLAIGAAFIIYLLIHILSYWIDPSSLYSGLLWKIIIIGFFCFGLFNALKIHRINKTIQ